MDSNFIKTIMEQDLKNGKVEKIITRFPPEPNAYLHIGHARAIITNFELAKDFNGYTNLRFDDTNPVKEDKEFVDGIISDIKWLGYEPKNVYYGSDYFERTFEKAILLIKKGLAYVDDLSPSEVSKYRGTLTTPGIDSPYRNRSVSENLKLFMEMKDGKYQNGEKILRAKIDMASPNINMRDPALYRIIHINHHKTGNKWCIYPMYDFAHPLQDSFEGITHSLCSLEYDNHRPLYDWVIENCECEHISHQYEFGRLNISNTIMSKRYLKELVDKKIVSDYDDPRMPTLVGLRRRGVTANAIKNFILSAGLSRVNSTIESEMLEEAIRNDLKLKVARKMGVIKPLKVTITNYPDNEIEYLEVENNSECEDLGKRKIAFSKHLYIEQDDFVLEKPNKKWKRLALGLEVRLYGAYFIKCNDVVRDNNGNIVELLCTYDPITKSNTGFNERKPNGTIHFVEATTSLNAEFRIIHSLLLPDSDENLELTERINPNSLEVHHGFVEKSFSDAKVSDSFQLLRNGYYTVDKDSTPSLIVLNETASLKSSFNK